MVRRWILSNGHEGYEVQRQGPNLKIVLDRPKKGNAMTFAMLEGIRTLLQVTAKDKTIFRILFTGNGKFFCTGMDLKAVENEHHGSQNPHQRQWDGIMGLLQAIEDSPQVTVALVNGPAFGLGIGITFACDIRLTIESATFTVSEAQLGIPPTILMKQLVREWGVSRAREATLSARPVTSTELHSAGIVHGLATTTDGLDGLDGLEDEWVTRLSTMGQRRAD